MAGKHQHHIWQMLQRGFGRREFSQDHIWIFTKNSPPRKTTTANYGQEKNFYGPAGSAADENITQFENSVQSFIQDARRLDNDAELDPSTVAPLVTMLEMRSNFLRKEMSMWGDLALNRVKDAFKTPADARSIMRKYIDGNPELIFEKLVEAGVHPEAISRNKKFIEFAIKNHFESISGDISRDVTEILNTFLGLAQGLAKGAHIKALEADFSEAGRTHHHSLLNFRIRRSLTADLILPDTGMAWVGKSIRPISVQPDRSSDVIIPICSSAYIYGYPKNPIVRDTETVNSLLASCSFIDFVAASNSSGHELLCRKIGKNAKVLSDAEMRSALNLKDVWR